METRRDLSGAWSLYYGRNGAVKEFASSITCASDAEKYLGKPISAHVPGNFELDFHAAGLIPDPYFGTNTLEMQKLENMHLWYCTEFDCDEPSDKYTYLHFEGIDTVADIYLNGKLLARTDNMFIPHEFPADNLVRGRNEITVHILPAVIYARSFDVPAGCDCSAYAYESMYMRKCASMYGWDIMPRIVSGGIWRPVYIVKKQPERIEDIFMYTLEYQRPYASMYAYFSLRVEDDDLTRYRLRIHGSCGESRFEADSEVNHTNGRVLIRIDDPRYWWPKNCGEPNLYDCVCELVKDGEVIDTFTLKTGIRTVKLSMTPTTDKDGNGDFCFIINGKRVFAMGTNWVPLDAFHSRDAQRLQPALDMLDDLGCNMVRVWGGNVYESDAFYDFCDAHGILVWQDFMMGCAVYPQDRQFANMITPEATYIIKHLRNHPSLALWAGDNECDVAYNWHGVRRDPGEGIITRRVLKELTCLHDFTRPFLPSSPYVSPEAFATGAPTPEDHLWGPRDWFKGDYYRNSVCHFASETGYHGCPSPASLRKFLSEESVWPMLDADGNANAELLAHATAMRADNSAPYAFRIGLMHRQVKCLFGELPDNIDDFALMSQISQAEALKYYIERFRITRGRRTGILWWNLVDGWPQISDAVVDWYYNKKVAYNYIKRCQKPVLLAFDEPDENGMLNLYGISEHACETGIEYTVTDITNDTVLASGRTVLKGEASSRLTSVPVKQDEHRMLFITWKTANGVTGFNHFYTNLIGINYASYISDADKCGLVEATK